MKISVFCSSSDNLPKIYFSDAEKLGKLLVDNKMTLVHGAGKIGLMGKISRSAKANGGYVIGVIPERLNLPGVVSLTDDETIVTKDMGERKKYMLEISDGFIALAGGFGTLEEILEMITLKQLKYHNKPIVIVNTNNFYDFLLKQFEIIFCEKFAIEGFRNLYSVVNTPEEAIERILNYSYNEVKDKYL
jgi:cytokinin riboside 5'-monophosphate phosphoribohydrolase